MKDGLVGSKINVVATFENRKNKWIRTEVRKHVEAVMLSTPIFFCRLKVWQATTLTTFVDHPVEDPREKAVHTGLENLLVIAQADPQRDICERRAV